MPSYTYTSTTTTTSSEGTTSRNMRAASAGSDLDDLYFKSFCMSDGDRCRMGREFFSPAPISLTGNYWPRCFSSKLKLSILQSSIWFFIQTQSQKLFTQFFLLFSYFIFQISLLHFSSTANINSKTFAITTLTFKLDNRYRNCDKYMYKYSKYKFKNFHC